MRVAAVCLAVSLAWCSGAGAQIDIDNRDVKVDPSGEASPEYGRSIDERNRKKREEAERSGESHIDTTFGPLKGAESKGESQAEPKGGKKAAKPELPQVPGGAAKREELGRKEIPETRGAAAGPGYEGPDEEVERAELRELVGELLKALDRGPSVVRLRAPPEDSAERGRAGAATPTPAAAPRFPPVRAGAGLYGRVLYAVNSDFQGPVMVELLEPPLAGAVLTGRFERVREELAVRLSRISWRGAESPVEAWAVGLDCACYGIGGEVDRHWWERLILPAAVRFAEGFLIARGSAGRRVEVSGETVVDERGEPTSRQAVLAGLGNAARSAGEILLQDAPAGPTVRIPRDTEIAVVFARPPGARTSAVSAAGRGPRGPTGGGVVRSSARPPAGGAEDSPDGRGGQPAGAAGGRNRE